MIIATWAAVVIFAGMEVARAAEPACSFRPDLVALQYAFPRTASRLDTRGTVKIVALGSSSTAGAGATTAQATYPARLQANLAARWPGEDVVIVNRGRNGDRLPDMLARLETDVFAERPDLIIWQLGTNALLADVDPNRIGALLLAGVRAIRVTGADLIIMDPQFAPKVLAHARAGEVVGIIDDTAVQAGAALFRRFALMRFWHEEHLGFEQILSPDQLHMNDWSYGCLAEALAFGLAEALHPSR
jgi:lysophospholipase L1-like esterase